LIAGLRLAAFDHAGPRKLDLDFRLMIGSFLRQLKKVARAEIRSFRRRSPAVLSV